MNRGEFIRKAFGNVIALAAPPALVISTKTPTAAPITNSLDELSYHLGTGSLSMITETKTITFNCISVDVPMMYTKTNE